MLVFASALVEKLDIMNTVGFDPNAAIGPTHVFFTLVRAAVGVVLLCIMLPPLSDGPTEYFGLVIPRLRLVAKYSAVMVLLVGAPRLLRVLRGMPLVPDSSIDAYRAAGSPLAYFAALVIAAPLYEELLFRGFLFKGIARSRLGGWAALAITTASWAALHTQYRGYQIVPIAINGLYYGWARWKTGSTGLAVLLHAITNAVVVGEAAIAFTLMN
jgi:membrane protease YdiL (CAAX protease family)